jgi:hypothetical protein
MKRDSCVWIGAQKQCKRQFESGGTIQPGFMTSFEVENTICTVVQPCEPQICVLTVFSQHRREKETMAGFENQGPQDAPSKPSNDVQPDASTSDAQTPLGAQLLGTMDAMKIFQSYLKAKSLDTSPITPDSSEPTSLDMGNQVFNVAGTGTQLGGLAGSTGFSWKAVGNDAIEIKSSSDDTIYDTKGDAFTKTKSGYTWYDVDCNKTALTAQGEGVKIGADGSIQTYTVPIPGVSPPTRSSNPSN